MRKDRTSHLRRFFFFYFFYLGCFKHALNGRISFSLNVRGRQRFGRHDIGVSSAFLHFTCVVSTSSSRKPTLKQENQVIITYNSLLPIMLSSSHKDTYENPLSSSAGGKHKHGKQRMSSSGKDKTSSSHRHTHSYQEPTPIYLDQIVSAPHFPRPEGTLPPTSKVIMPDLQRTGIRSRYSKDWPTQPFDISGRITNEFLAETSSTLKTVPEPNLPLFYKESRPNYNHRVNLSKTLVDFEDKREERYQIMRRDLRSRVKSIGFTHIDSASMCLSPLALTHSVKSFKSTEVPNLRYARAQSMSPLKGQDTAAETAVNHINGSPYSKSEKSPLHNYTSSSTPKTKVFSRITFFKECLAAHEPPKTFKKKRFGVLGRRTTMPALLTPTTLSARESNNGDEEEEEYGDDTVEYKDEGGIKDTNQGRLGDVGEEEEENYQDDQEFDEEVAGPTVPIQPQIDH